MSFLKEFPSSRSRRLRQSAWIRDMVAENKLHPHDLIQPIFVTTGASETISSMPGVSRLSLSDAVAYAQVVQEHGIRAVAIFPVVPAAFKTPCGARATAVDNLMCQAIKAIKQAVPDLGIIADVALDPYTTHGQDGVLNELGQVCNDATLDVLVQQAINQARAGCDVIAPSDMMDGRVGRIRHALDQAGYQHVSIMSYSAKYASAFYGPFRDAVGSKNFLASADKKTYQQDFANSDEALQEIALDIREGADWIMIKPGMPYLDIVRRAHDTFKVPISVYQVSGEYTMLSQLATLSGTPFTDLMFESLMAFKRAGASSIFCYASLTIAELMAKK